MELLQTIEKHCSRFPSLGTLDLGTGEKIGSELEKLLCRGVSALACIHLVNLGTDKTHFRTFQTPDNSEGSEDECETPSKRRSEYARARGE